jgi:hypothetical protein
MLDRRRREDGKRPESHGTPGASLIGRGGDWNFGAEAEDRAHSLEATFSSRGDSGECQELKQQVEKTVMLELAQDEHAHRSATGLSRTNRIYAGRPLS